MAVPALAWWCGPVAHAVVFGSRPLAGPIGVTEVVAADLDGDGAPDRVLGGSELGWNRVVGSPAAWPYTRIRWAGATALAAADLDGDGDLDLTTPEGWHESDGFGGFGPARDVAGAWVPADLDGDGAPDLCSSSGEWTRNLGRGEFADPAPIPGAPASSHPVPMDFDADGDVDLLFVQLPGGDLTAWSNDGAAGLAGASALTADVGSEVVVSDLDGDGAPDLVWRTWGWELRSVELSGGVFGPVSVLSPYSFCAVGLAADLDGDLDEDVLCASGDWLELAGGAFLPEVNLFAGTGALASFDYDRDGDLDLVDQYQVHENAGYLDRDGDGVADGAEVAQGTDPELADTDGDGLTDLEERRFGTDPTDAADAGRIDRDGDHLSVADELAAGTSDTTGDSDGDGAWDAVERDAGTDPLVGDTDGDGFLDGHERECDSDPLDPTAYDTDCDGLDDALEGVHLTDLNDPDSDDDGLVDGAEVEQAATDPLDPDSDAGGTLDGEEWARGTEPLDARDDWRRRVVFGLDLPCEVAPGDLDGDGDLDVAATCFVGVGTTAYWLESVDRGAGFVPHALPFPPYVYVYELQVTDFDGDRVDDLVWGGAWDPAPPGGPTLVHPAWDPIPVDTDGDGDQDLVGPTSAGLAVLLQQGGGSWSAPIPIEPWVGGLDHRPGDLDGDGDVDVVFGFGADVRWLENMGWGVFAPSVSIAVTDYAQQQYVQAAADVDGDGAAEVLTAGGSWPDYQGAVFELNGGRTDVPGARALLAGDLDRDGVVDLVRGLVGGIGWGPLGGAERVVMAGDELPAAVVDVDGDGDLDVLATYGRTEAVVWFENALDDDLDRDGVPNAADPCPVDAPDDADGDGTCDADDICPGADDRADADQDGAPDACDRCPAGDDRFGQDGDGVPDACDPCPADAPDDPDGDGVCGVPLPDPHSGGDLAHSGVGEDSAPLAHTGHTGGAESRPPPAARPERAAKGCGCASGGGELPLALFAVVALVARRARP